MVNKMTKKNYFFLVRLLYYFILFSIPVMADTCNYQNRWANMSVTPCAAYSSTGLFEQEYTICSNVSVGAFGFIATSFDNVLKDNKLYSKTSVCYPYDAGGWTNKNCTVTLADVTSSINIYSNLDGKRAYYAGTFFNAKECKNFIYRYVPNNQNGKTDLRVWGNSVNDAGCILNNSCVFSNILDPTYNYTDGLIAAYPMNYLYNNNFIDAYTGKYNATAKGITLIPSFSGGAVNASNFTLALGNITTGLKNTDQKVQSLSVWVKFHSTKTGANNWNTISSDDGCDGSAGTAFGQNIYWGGAPCQNYLNLLVGNTHFCTNWYPNISMWYHLVYSFNTTDTKIYLNGSLLYSGSGATYPTTNYNYSLGVRWCGGGNVAQLAGELDEAYLWNRMVNATEVSNLYNNSYGIFYPFAEGGVPISITFDQRNPDVNSTNLFDQRFNVSYNISNGIVSTYQLYYNMTANGSLEKIYTNGTSVNIQGNRTFTYNVTNTFYWFLDEFDIYHATYNYPELLMRNYTKQNESVGVLNANLKQINFLNFSTTENNAFLEINLIPGTLPLSISYCNESNQNPTTNPKCTNIYNLQITGESYHCHLNNISCHYVIPIIISEGKINGKNVVSTPSFYLFGGSGWNIKYIPNISRAGAFRTSSNNGNTWADDVGTPDSHIHSQTPQDILTYYVCGNTTGGASVCTSERQENLTLLKLPPTSPVVFSPNSTTFDNQRIFINYTAAISQFNQIVFYSISLYNTSDLTLISVITNNNSLNLNYTIANSSILGNGVYRIGVTATDNESLSSFGLSDSFVVSNSIITPPSPTAIADSLDKFTNMFMYFLFSIVGILCLIAYAYFRTKGGSGFIFSALSFFIFLGQLAFALTMNNSFKIVTFACVVISALCLMMSLFEGE